MRLKNCFELLGGSEGKELNEMLGVGKEDVKASTLFLSLLNLPAAEVVNQNFSAVSAESTIT